MQPRPAHARLARRALLCLTLACCLGWGSAALAQEAAPEVPSAPALPQVGAPAPWQPVFRRAERAGVVVSPNFVAARAAGEPLQVRLQNSQPFAVQLRGLLLRQRGQAEIYWAPEVSLGPGERTLLTLAPASLEPQAQRELERASRAAPVSFTVLVEPSALEGAMELFRSLSPSQEPLRPLPELVQEAARVRHAQVAMAREARQDKQRGLESSPVQRQASLLDALAPRLERRACEAHLEGLRDPEQRSLLLSSYVQLRQLQQSYPELDACMSVEDHAAAVELLLREGHRELATQLSERFEEGTATREPFKKLLGMRARRQLTRFYAAAQDDAAQLEQVPYDTYRAYQELWRVESLEPQHERVADARQALAELASEAAVERADGRDLRSAHYLLDLMQQDLEHALASGALTPAQRRLVDRARRRVAFEEGQFLFHYRRGEEAQVEKAHAAFRQAMPEAPVASRLYLGGLWVTQHQLLSLFLGLALALSGLGVGRSRWLSRALLRLRIGLAGLRQSPGAWSLLTHVTGLAGEGKAEARLRGLGAARLLEADARQMDTAALEEAGRLMREVEPALRPERWRGPAEPLRDLALQVDLLRDGLGLSAVQHSAQVLAEIFDGAGQRAAQALRLEAGCRLAVSRGQQPGPALREALERWRLAQEQARSSSLSAWCRARAGLALAELGPSCQELGPQEAWAQAWERLAPLEDAQALGLSPARLASARVMAAAAAGSSLEAVLALRQHEALLRDPELRQRGDTLSAALLTAANQARLPTASPEASVEEARQQLKRDQRALAALDDLLTEHLRPEEALDARLRLALLRRLGGEAAGLLGQEYEADRQELFALARQHRDRPVTAALAASLDLLTEGDQGFDEDVAQARGAQRDGFGLLEALDHLASGRPLEAAQTLVQVQEDQESPDRRARLRTARAVVAASIGQHRAAREALRGALEAAHQASAQAVEAVDRAASRLLGSVLEAQAPAVELLESASRGWLSRLGERPPQGWLALAHRLAPAGQVELVLFLLQRSHAEDGGEDGQGLRQRLLVELSRRALSQGDYTLARRCAILSSSETTDGRRV